MFPVTIPDCYINENGSFEHHVTATIDLDRYVFRLKGTRPGLWKKYPIGEHHNANSGYFTRILLPASFEGVTSMEQLKVVCDMKRLTVKVSKTEDD